ncbi:MAG: hypothetical protein ACRDOU_00450 [Streptosporangiaceae bacterium]
MAGRTIGIIDGQADTEAGPYASLVHLRCTAADALSNLVGVLELAADGQVRCSAATRRPFAATVALVDDALVAGDYYEGEPIASFAWPLLLQVGGLARRAGTTLELTSRGRAVLARPSYTALGALWDRWLTSVSHDELSRIEVIKGQRRSATLTPAVTRRAAVAAGLAALPPGAWTQVGALLSILRTGGPRLAVTRTLMARWSLYIADAYYGSLGHAGSQAWDVIEGRYALCVLLEYAATIGLIDVAYTDPQGARHDYQSLWGAGQYRCLSRYDGLRAVRVNELGAAILHDPDALPSLGLPVPRRG